MDKKIPALLPVLVGLVLRSSTPPPPLTENSVLIHTNNGGGELWSYDQTHNDTLQKWNLKPGLKRTTSCVRV